MRLLVRVVLRTCALYRVPPTACSSVGYRNAALRFTRAATIQTYTTADAFPICPDACHTRLPPVPPPHHTPLPLRQVPSAAVWYAPHPPPVYYRPQPLPPFIPFGRFLFTVTLALPLRFVGTFITVALPVACRCAVVVALLVYLPPLQDICSSLPLPLPVPFYFLPTVA